MDYCSSRPLRSSRSDHTLTQEARIEALLDEMRPYQQRSRPIRISDEDAPPPSPPSYDVIFQPKHAPPPYSQLVLRPVQSVWTVLDREPLSKPNIRPTWAGCPKPLKSMKKIPLTDDSTTSTFSLPDDSVVDDLDCGITPRNTPRQASFMAAMTRQEMSDQDDDGMRCCLTKQATPLVPRRVADAAKPTARDVILRNTTNRENRRTTVYGDHIFSKQTRHESQRDLNHNVSALTRMRRARPKSYVLATSTSLPETEHPMSFSRDDSRELSSLGSLSSIDRSSRSAQSHNQPQGHHRIQKFIALFSHQNSPVKLRTKRSRTSLPLSRNPLPETTLRASKIVRQGWLRHQELELGKIGKRRLWEECWAVLIDQSLYLCPQEPRSTVAEKTGEKLIHLPPCARVDVHSSIIDIAYEWLAMSRTKHVIRLVTQTRAEHLFELDSEADMLSWIATLQSCAEGTISPQLHSSCSAASLASSSSTPSERNGHTTSATNQLIMHRYKAKSSQLQSPVSSKRPMANDVHCAQPGTSKDSSSGENGEPSTPKSGRKWKKTKAIKQGSGGTAGSTSSGVGGPPSGVSVSSVSGTTSVSPTQNVLGVRLADCPTTGPDDLVPLCVQICVSVVEAHGLDTVGIYRIPGNTAAVNALKEMFSHGLDTMTLENLDLSDPRWRDVNVVSSFLKMFLRKLPEPLLTDKLYPFFIDANRIANHHNRLHKLRNLLRKLPRHHYATLRYLIFHLAEITKNSEVNKMETRNLALMFGPSIVRPSDDNMATMVTHMSDQCKIIETLIHYHEWMFDDNSTADDSVPEQHPSETGASAVEAPQYGVGVPSGVSAASFNDMHNLIRKANEEQAAAMMNEGKAGKIKNILRRNSRRDKSKSKLKIESTAPAAMNPRPGGASTTNAVHYSSPSLPPASHSPSQHTGVESAFCGNYQERDIDAEIMSRQLVSPLAAAPPSALEQSPSVESSLGSIPDTSRTDPGASTSSDAGEAQARRKRQQDIYSARRIFIAGSAAAADDASGMDALANHTQHLNIANSPALEVLSEETREKIRKMQRRQNWMDPLSLTFPTSHLTNTTHISAPDTSAVVSEPPSSTQSEPAPKTCSPTKDMTDALSCTSDYSTTSSAPLTAPLAVACAASSSDYASSFSDPSPCARNASASPRQRPQVLGVLPEARCQQKIRLRNRPTPRDPTRRHTLSDMDVLKEGRLEKFARWFGIRKSSPDVSSQNTLEEETVMPKNPPPVIVRTSPNELTPASGDEQL
ncbi:hypothetical protein V3C99_000247 [Haemonchus contortus]